MRRYARTSGMGSIQIKRNFMTTTKAHRHHISYWELTINKHNRYHLPQSFNRKYYDVIEVF